MANAGSSGGGNLGAAMMGFEPLTQEMVDNSALGSMNVAEIGSITANSGGGQGSSDNKGDEATNNGQANTDQGSDCDGCSKKQESPPKDAFGSLDYSGHNSSEKHFNFGTGKSPFKLKEINYLGVGEGVSLSYGALQIDATHNTPEELRGQSLTSHGLTLGAGVGSPVEVFSGTVGNIYFHQNVSGNSLEEIFSSTNFVTVQSYSALFKYTTISGYDSPNMNNLIWSAKLYGGGVITAGLHGSRSVVKFTNAK